MEYEVIKQSYSDERVFTIKDKEGNTYEVDLYTDGAFDDYKEDDTSTNEKWRNWLKNKFLGKTMYIERLMPYKYFTAGEQKIIK